jgi:hypothetical protein
MLNVGLQTVIKHNNGKRFFLRSIFSKSLGFFSRKITEKLLLFPNADQISEDDKEALRPHKGTLPANNYMVAMTTSKINQVAQHVYDREGKNETLHQCPGSGPVP